jgi:hypothetical protein
MSTGQPEGEFSKIDETFGNALNWLNVVGEFEEEHMQEKIDYSRDDVAVLRYLGNCMVNADLDTASVLSTLEVQAREIVSTGSTIPTEAMQTYKRVNQFLCMSQMMNDFATEQSERAS